MPPIGHTLIVGKTMSGKTTLAKKLVNGASSEGVPLLVLTPFAEDATWQADFVTDDPEKFLKMVFNTTRCQVVIDEAGETIGQFDKSMNKIATRGRHYGHQAFFIAQRPTMINVNTRTQCTNCFCFMQWGTESKELVKDFADALFVEAPNLKQGECIAKVGYKPAFKLNVFTEH